MANIHGRLGMVIVMPQVQIDANSWSFQMDTDLVETSTMGNSWKTWLSLPLKWEGSITGVLDDSNNNLMNAVSQSLYGNGNQTVQLLFYPNKNNTARYYIGNAWPKLSVTVGITGTERYTFSFVGDGALQNF